MALPARVSSGGFKLSDESLAKIRAQESVLVQACIDDMSNPDPKVSLPARKMLMELGFRGDAKKEKGVVALLIERARQGEFGKQAQSYDGTKAVAPVEVVEPEEAPDGECVVDEVQDPLADVGEIDDVGGVDPPHEVEYPGSVPGNIRKGRGAPRKWERPVEHIGRRGA